MTIETRLLDEVLSIEIKADTLARFIELELEGADIVFSDNYFDLPAGATARITCALPGGWTLDKAQAALKVRTLYDSFS